MSGDAPLQETTDAMDTEMQQQDTTANEAGMATTEAPLLAPPQETMSTEEKNMEHVQEREGEGSKDVDMTDVAELKRQLAEAQATNARFAAMNRANTENVTKSFFSAVGFDPSVAAENSDFGIEEAKKMADAFNKISQDDPATINAFQSFVKLLGARGGGAAAPSPPKASAQKTATATTKSESKTAPAKENDNGNAGGPLKNNATARADTKNTTPSTRTNATMQQSGMKRPGFNLQQNQMGYHTPSTGTGAKRASNYDPLESIFPDYNQNKRPRTANDVKTQFSERFDQSPLGTTTQGIKASDRLATRTTKDYSVLSPGASALFLNEIGRQIGQFTSGSSRVESPFFRSSGDSLFSSSGPSSNACCFSVSASQHEAGNYTIRDSAQGLMVLPKVYNYSKVSPCVSDRNAWNVSASVLEKTFSISADESQLPPVTVGGIIDWNASMLVGYASDESIAETQSVMASECDVNDTFAGRFSVLASDALPCGLEFDNDRLATMADIWKHSPMFSDMTERDVAVMDVIYNSPLLGAMLAV